MGNLTLQDEIDILQRKIIVHSVIYYQFNTSVISDREYDNMSRKLVEYKKSYPDLWKNSMYHEQFGDDYNGSTGFDLWYGLDERQQRIILSIVKAAPGVHV